MDRVQKVVRNGATHRSIRALTAVYSAQNASQSTNITRMYVLASSLPPLSLSLSLSLLPC